MTMDANELRRALGHFVTGVTVVTTRCAAGTLQGITANSFSSVSLDPPLVLISIARSLRSFHHFKHCNTFAIHLLSDEQRDISRRFAAQGAQKWEGIEVQEGMDGVPLLPSRLGLFECTLHATYDGGDHEILLGRVVRCEVDADVPPLVYFKGAYRSIAA
jgi:flavin reductase (DIM6/NTAB) family NADH-FMN oxidoreductase RutF